MWCNFWISHWQEKHKAQFQRSLSIHENYAIYKFYSCSFFILPLATETWCQFCYSCQSGEKQLLTQYSFFGYFLGQFFFSWPLSWFKNFQSLAAWERVTENRKSKYISNHILYSKSISTTVISVDIRKVLDVLN